MEQTPVILSIYTMNVSRSGMCKYKIPRQAGTHRGVALDEATLQTHLK